MNDLKTIFEKLKKINKLETDAKLAKELKIENKDITNLRYRNTLTTKASEIIINYADKNNIDLNWLFLNKELKPEDLEGEDRKLLEEFHKAKIEKMNKSESYFMFKVDGKEGCIKKQGKEGYEKFMKDLENQIIKARKKELEIFGKIIDLQNKREREIEKAMKENQN